MSAPEDPFRPGLEECRLIVEAWLVLLACHASLRCRSLGSVIDRARVPVAPAGPVAGGAIERVARCVEAAAGRHILPMRCLERSLALQRMLRRRGVSAELRIGVAGTGPSVAAHAWLELGGRPIAEPAAVRDRFLPLIRPLG